MSTTYESEIESAEGDELEGSSEESVESALSELLMTVEFDDDLGEPFECLAGSRVESVASFDERGILTSNRGLVVSMSDGSEYQLTIVRSR